MTAPECTQPDTDAVRQFAEELRKWWSFDDRQQHTHSWHSREDFIERKLLSLLYRAAPAEVRAEEALHEIAKEVFTDGTPTKAARIALAALALSRPNHSAPNHSAPEK